MRRRTTVNVRRGPGLVGTMARTAVIAGTATATATAVSGAMHGSAQKKAAAQQQAQMQEQQQAELQAQQAAEQAAPQEAAPASGGLDDAMVQLQKLAQMRDMGLITDDDFEAKKRQILGL